METRVMMRFAMLAGAVGVLACAAPAAAGTKVELKHVHMCCGGCAEEMENILNAVEGVTDVATEQEAKTARFTAADTKAAQRALDALAAGGFHGDTGGSTE